MAKDKLPAGPTRLHANMASGMPLKQAVEKATTKDSKETPKR